MPGQTKTKLEEEMLPGANEGSGTNPKWLLNGFSHKTKVVFVVPEFMRKTLSANKKNNENIENIENIENNSAEQEENTHNDTMETH